MPSKFGFTTVEEAAEMRGKAAAVGHALARKIDRAVRGVLEDLNAAKRFGGTVAGGVVADGSLVAGKWELRRPGATEPVTVVTLMGSHSPPHDTFHLMTGHENLSADEWGVLRRALQEETGLPT